MGVVKRVEHILRSKGVAGADGGDNLFGDTSSLGDVFERLLHIFGDKQVHKATSNCNHGDDRGQGKGEFPLPDEGDDETNDKSGHKTDSHRDLLGNTLLYKI